MSHKQDDSEKDEGWGFFSGLLVGGLIGAAAGLLMAPSSGKETVALIRDRGLEIKDQIEQSARDARDRAETVAHDLRSKAETVVDETRTKVMEKKGKLERTAEAATRAAQDAWAESETAN